MQRTSYCCQISIKFEFSRLIFEKCSNIKIHENTPNEAEFFHAEGRTDMTKLIVDFRNFSNAPKMSDIIYP